MATQRKPRAIDDPNLRGARILLIDSRFHEEIADELVAGALEYLAPVHASVTRVSVPGALEIPIAAAVEIEAAGVSGQHFEGLIALGCVIRGETLHFEIVSKESVRALITLAVTLHLPLGTGILTVDNEAQAWARARRTEGNKGAAAAEAALRLVQIARGAGALKPWR
jgi:6,7-dimethyl-8-ribityllumazine synthase